MSEASALSALSTVLSNGQSTMAVWIDSPPLGATGPNTTYPYVVLSMTDDWQEIRTSNGSKQPQGTIVVEYIDLLGSQQSLTYDQVMANARTNLETVRSLIRGNITLSAQVSVAGETIETKWAISGQAKDRFGMDVYFVPLYVSILDLVLNST